MSGVLGLDIGGANLKAAHTSGAARARSFPLWRSSGRLAEELRRLIADMPAHEMLAVTMTAELCDCFATRADGVRAILASAVEVASVPIGVWTTAGRFVDLAKARDDPIRAAAANWLALGHLAARLAALQPALLLDIGSTTTDIVYLDGGAPRPRGLTDRQRLDGGELVYTGVRRTPVCAVLGMEVAAEVFATMLDVMLTLELCPERPDDCDTADGRPGTRRHAAARLARLRCSELDDLAPGELEKLAARALDRQLQYLLCAVDRALAGRPWPRQLILAGSGEMLARQVCAQHPLLAALPILSLADELGPGLSEAAAAYAVAILAQETLG